MKQVSTWRGVALLGAALLLPLGAAATIPAEPLLSNSVTVKYRPSRAATADGAARLYESLRSAAAAVCRDPATPPLVVDSDYRACASTALEQAVEKVNLPAIRELHLQDRKR